MHRKTGLLGIALVLVVLAVGTQVAQAGGDPSLAFTPPGTYAYGALAGGESKLQTFTLRNSGGSASAKLTITLTGSGAFTITADSCSTKSLNERKSCSVTVRYAPSGPNQTDSATLTARGDKQAALVSVSLTGSSIIQTTIAAASDGMSLPQATINVADTASFPTAGTLIVASDSGPQTVTYTEKTETSFTGASGGVGLLSTGGLVVLAGG